MSAAESPPDYQRYAYCEYITDYQNYGKQPFFLSGQGLFFFHVLSSEMLCAYSSMMQNKRQRKIGKLLLTLAYKIVIIYRVYRIKFKRRLFICF